MIEFRVLGAIDLRLADARSPKSVLSRSKDLALLAYLTLATPRGFHRRDTLLALFWPDSNDTRARGALNQCLYRLRQSLGGGLVITRGGDEVGLDWNRWWCDVVELRAAYAARHYAAVVRLYGGELLNGFHADASPEFEQWLDAERRNAREAAATAANQLASASEAAGNDVAAIEWLRQAINIKPLEESSLQKLMELLHRNGQAGTARAEYERFTARLAADLGTEPSRQTMLVASRIRENTVATPADGFTLVPEPVVADLPVIPRPRRSLVWQGGLAALAILSVAYVVGAGDSTSPSNTSRHVVIADFENRTNEQYLGAAITEALNVDISQSSVIRVASRAQVGAVLARMGQDTVTVLTELMAREVAVREGIAGVLRGQVAKVGSTYVITAQLITADSGRVLLSAREHAQRDDDVLAAIDALSDRLRKRMGDSLRGARANLPLEAVTTHSLEALKLYSAGMRTVRFADVGDGLSSGGLPGRIRPDDRAVSLFEQAIALDSTFASAYRALGVHLYWLGDQRTRVRELLTHAYQLRDQLTERERLRTEGTYFHFVLGEYDRAIVPFEQLLDRDPHDIVAIQHLGMLYFRQQDFTRAVKMYERDWALRGGAPAMLYTSALLGTGNVARADSILRYFAALDSNGGLWLAELIRLRAGLGDFAAVDSLLHLMQVRSAKASPSIRFHATRMAGLWKIWRGSYGDGIALLESVFGSPAASLAGAPTFARFQTYVLRDPARALRTLTAALARAPIDSLPAADRPYVFLANQFAHAGDHQRAAQFLRQHRFVAAPWAGAGATASSTYAVVALGRAATGDIAGARQTMRAAEREIGCWYDTQWLHLARFRVEEQAGHPDSAVAALERLVAVPDCKLTLTWSDLWGPVTQAYGHERLAQLYDARGDAPRAALHYAKFVELWPKPDPLLAPRWHAAKNRLAELSRDMRQREAGS